MREGWRMQELGEIAFYVKDKIEAKRLNSDNYISADNMIGDVGGITKSEYVPVTGKSSHYMEKDILVSNIRPYFKKMWYATFSGGCSNDVFILRVREESVDSKFLFYRLSNQDFFDFMMAGANGTKMPRGNKNAILNFKVTLPPLETQKKIDSILSGYDDLIENNLKRINILEEMAQQTYEEWFVRMRFPGHESATINPETGLPEGWEKVKLGDISVFKYGSMPKKDDIVESGFPVYSGYRITGFSKKFNISKKSLIVVARGVGGTGDVKFSPEKCWLTNLSILVNLNNNENINYLYYYLKAGNLRSLDSGAAQSQITIISLEPFPIVLPKIELIKRFNEIVEPIFGTIDILQNQNQRLREARDILLPRLMMGMIDV